MSQALNSVIESLNALTLEEKHQLLQILEKELFQTAGDRINTPQQSSAWSALSAKIEAEGDEPEQPSLEEISQIVKETRRIHIAFPLR